MIVLSMLMFLSSHLLVVLDAYIEDVVVFFGIIISINLLIDISLTIGFCFLFVVIMIILIEI